MVLFKYVHNRALVVCSAGDHAVHVLCLPVPLVSPLLLATPISSQFEFLLDCIVEQKRHSEGLITLREGKIGREESY